MLTKRTNILFDEQIFRSLATLAARKNTSIGNLVRLAVTKVYIEKNDDQKVKAYEKIYSLRKSVKKVDASDIKDFIEYGRSQ